MKKQGKSRKPKNRNSKSKRTSEQEFAGESGRRDFLRLARNVTIGAALLGGTGYVLAGSYRETMHEHDLDRVNNGIPTVVQIHDPQCRLCQALQGETRKALEMMDEGSVDYVVANIRTAKGQDFATRYGVPHVTLLLFDKNGRLRNTLQGQRGSHELKREFERLIPRQRPTI